MNAEHCYDIPLDSIPIPVLIVDEDVRVLKYNDAAKQSFGDSKKEYKTIRTGDMMQCLNSFEADNGCGYSSVCKKCVVRNSVKECYTGTTIIHKMVNLVIKTENKFTKVNLLITVNKLHKFNKTLALLIVEDVTKIFMTKDVVPVCMHCRKLRDDDEYWHSHEDYLDKFLNVKLSHCICGTCFEKFYHSLTDDKKT